MGRQLYEILCADAFRWLERRRAKSIHAVVTDPPYSVLEYTPEQLNKQRNGRGGIWRLPHNYDGSKRKPVPRFTVLRSKDLERLQDFHARLSPQLFRVLVPGGHVIIASQHLLCHFVVSAFTDAGFEIRGQIARIVKTLRGGDRPKGAHEEFRDLSVSPRSCWEPWLIFRKPCEGRVKENLEKWHTGALRRPQSDVPFKDLIESAPARGTEKRLAPHPSLKPQAFVRQIVRASLPLGKGVILDPFMGSGSTIAAAHHLGLRSIGIEMDEEFFELAQTFIPELSKLQVNGTR
ncbi:site-specific DNA-methyltransferase [Acidobacteria bacterium AH-259-G07]|nr:site-specific DNA-methyltransferase [Acidobacteria bacterium AH-259-G07]